MQWLGCVVSSFRILGFRFLGCKAFGGLGFKGESVGISL